MLSNPDPEAQVVTLNSITQYQRSWNQYAQEDKLAKPNQFTDHLINRNIQEWCFYLLRKNAILVEKVFKFISKRTAYQLLIDKVIMAMDRQEILK